MAKKGFLLFGTVCLLGVGCGVGLFSLINPLDEKETRAVKVDKVIHVKKEVTKQSSQPEILDKTNSLFDSHQVVGEAVYPRLNIDGSKISENIMPMGTVVSVKPVPENDEWVEIVSDPPKGFIEKRLLTARQEHIAAREAKRQGNLSPLELKAQLDAQITDFLAKNGGDVSIYLETVDQKFSYHHNGDKVNRTASSIKLPFIAYLMTLADQEAIDLTTELTFLEHNRMGGTGIIQFEPAGKNYTLKQLAELTIRYSDNIAYIMLLNHLGEANFINFLAKLDANSPNNRVFSTARILSKSMAYVHQKQEKNQDSHIGTLYDWLQQSTFDDGVAVGLPGVNVSHKTGWMPMYMVSNDIALVHDKERPYYITIMTNGYNDAYSEKAISDLSKLIDDQLLQLSHHE
ncbi:hypothetical protein CBF34_04765 [Vagococcus penaei]|uniref:Beta-lactamase class A catalytic domain-containing protein n=1 Tax=Vagococcus penaei TaxID=633807 RepID=A0A1Q2D4X7_9ENTE|nr:serine hydrolase [Vagococcus penaei]AQP53335.1 hypothetical protein BW732_03190 [Vagococcus penaei]RSU04106.1 hypothetical protein CBF34_04765 [Vagococcus penaei]